MYVEKYNKKENMPRHGKVWRLSQSWIVDNDGTEGVAVSVSDTELKWCDNSPPSASFYLCQVARRRCPVGGSRRACE